MPSPDPTVNDGLGGLVDSEMGVSVVTTESADSDEVGTGEVSMGLVGTSVDPEDDSEVDDAPASTPATEETSVAADSDVVGPSEGVWVVDVAESAGA